MQKGALGNGGAITDPPKNVEPGTRNVKLSYRTQNTMMMAAMPRKLP